MVLNIIKLARVFLNSRRFSFPLIRQLDFFEHFKFLICFTASFAIFLLTFYFYTRNIARCPLTFPNYQYRFCECDLLERDFHKFLNIPEYELNRLCVDHLDNPDILYVDTVIQFSNYMQTRNSDKGKGIVINVISSHKKCSGLQALIISGGVGDRGDELISPSGNVSCLLPKSGRMHHTHDGTLICGGCPGIGRGCYKGANTTCLNLTSSGWVETNHSLGRARHSSWAVDGGIILMAGYDPYDQRYNNDTEIVMFNGTSADAFSLTYSATMAM